MDKSQQDDLVKLAKISPRKSQVVKDLMAQCYANLGIHCTTMFPDRFGRKFGDPHKHAFQLLDDRTKQKVCIMFPRGFGKTSIIALGFASRYILFKEGPFIVYITNSGDNAEMRTEELKVELTTNTNIRKIFGDMQSGEFAKQHWVTSSGIMVLPRGAGQQVRGLLHRGRRPDLIIIDDIEKSEEVESEEQRAKMLRYLYSDVFNAVDRSTKSWRIVAIGTLLHEDSALASLQKDPSWECISYGIADDAGVPTWPEFMPASEIKALEDTHREQGLLDLFYREYMNLPISTKDSVFRSEYFKYYNDEDLVGKAFNLESVVLVDPAKTVKLHSADSAVVGVSIDTVDQRLYVRDVIAGKMYPDELYNAVFEVAAKIGAWAVGIEVTGLSEFITQPFKNEMSKRHAKFELVELKARNKKEMRVAALAPYYRSGHIYHKQDICRGLEAQLLSFPRPRRWDIMDCLAYVIEMMEIGERYFASPMHSSVDKARLQEERKFIDDLDRQEREWRKSEFAIPSGERNPYASDWRIC